MDRLTAIEARLAAIEAALPPAKKAPAPRQEDDGVKIFVSLPAANSKHLPNEDEARALLKIVTARYPQLKFRNADEELESFCASFPFICSLTKTAAPISKYSISWWIDTAQTWCRAANVSGAVRALLPAVIATADCQYSFDDRSAFWLDPYRSSGRVVDPTAWRKILNGGDLLVPTKINVPLDHSIGLQRMQATW